METIDISRQREGGILVTPSSAGLWQVWERPLVGCRYVVSVRGGGTMVTVGGKVGRERSVIMVLRKGYTELPSEEVKRARLVARLKPPIFLNPTPLGVLVATIADWYGRAACLVETKDGAIYAQECQTAGADAGSSLQSARVTSA